MIEYHIIRMSCYRRVVGCFVVHTGQLVPTDGPTDKCHVRNVTKRQFFHMVTLLARLQVACSAHLVCVCVSECVHFEKNASHILNLQCFF